MWGRQGLDGWNQSRDGRIPQSPPLGKNLFHLNVLAGHEHFVLTPQFNNTVSVYSKRISQRKPSY